MMDDDTALLPPNASKSGKHWLAQGHKTLKTARIWVWRAGIRHWEHRGLLRTPEAMARDGYCYVRSWPLKDDGR